MSVERANPSVRMDAGNLGTAHVSGNQIPKPSRRELDTEVLSNHQKKEEFTTNAKSWESAMPLRTRSDLRPSLDDTTAARIRINMV